MEKIFLKMLIEVVMTYLSKDNMLKAADALLDFIEDKIEESDTKIDDAFGLPVLRKFRETFGIPDND